MKTVTMTIGGMSCAHCVAAVQRALKSVPGVEATDVKIGSATVEFDPAHLQFEAIRDAVEGEGYVVVEAT